MSAVNEAPASPASPEPASVETPAAVDHSKAQRKTVFGIQGAETNGGAPPPPRETSTPEPDSEFELTLLQPEPNIPETDQRTHVVLTDERFMDYLARVPRGLQKDVCAVMLAVKGWRDEIARLKSMEKLPADGRGNIRVLKDTTTYHVRKLKPCIHCDDGTREGCAHEPAKHPVPKRRTFWQWLWGKKKDNPTLSEDHYTVEEKRVGIYTVLPAAQIKHYRRKFERQTAQALDWVYRMMRLWVGEDGKGRAEMIDALQASNGKLLPPSAGGAPIIFNAMPGNNPGPRPGGWVKNR